ncbi:energy transducer TonB [Maribellus sediminis]|uniref:energy transducer TonB n=1 Tax=Maribellus sediminis TaxID=2696285 RepID=UPI001431FC44|nr:energy transducer TonB [Maribellus sediminis]
MKAIILFLLFIVASSVVIGQVRMNNFFEEIKVSPPKFTGPEQETDLKNKSYNASFNMYLEDQIVYPKTAYDRQLEGTEVVRFVVNERSELLDFKVINSVSKDIDDAVIRAIKSTRGMWQPGTNNNDIVAMEKEVSVTFKLGQDEKVFNKEFVEIAEYYYKKGNKKFLLEDKPKHALNIYSAGLMYLPHDQSLLIMRGICYFELGNIDKAKKDWARVGDIDGVDESFYFLTEETK